MNKPLKMGKDSEGNLKYPLHRFRAKGFLGKAKNFELRASFGRPIKKESRRGKLLRFNKNGHRHNPEKK